MEEDPVDNDRIGQISPLDRIQRVEPSGKRDGKRKKGKRTAPDREATDPKKVSDPTPAEGKDDDEDPPTKGSRLDVRA